MLARSRKRPMQGPRTALSAAAAAVMMIALPLPSPSQANELDNRVVLSGQHQDQQFLAGEVVEVRATVADDVFAAAWETLFSDASVQRIAAVGRRLTIRSTTAQDMILAAVEVDFDGQVTDDLVAAGGRLHLRRTAEVGDDAHLAAANLDVEGDIAGDLYAAAHRITLSGAIGGDARIHAESIVLAPGARIVGNLVFSGASVPEIAQGASVTGTIEALEIEIPDFGSVSAGSIVAGAVTTAIVVTIGILLLIAALQFACPRLLGNAVETIHRRPWSTLGRGLVTLLVVPTAVIVLLVSVVGIPIALVTIAAFFVFLALAGAGAAYFIGLLVRRSLRRGDLPVSWASRTLWTACGILVLFLVGLVPLVGQVVTLLAFVAGSGAIAAQLRRELARPPAAAA